MHADGCYMMHACWMAWLVERPSRTPRVLGLIPGEGGFRLPLAGDFIFTTLAGSWQAIS